MSVRDFGWGSAPDPAGGTYSAPPDTLAGYMGHTSKGKDGRKDGREGQGREVRREGDLLLRRGEGMEEGKGREEGKGVEKGEGRVSPPPKKKLKSKLRPRVSPNFLPQHIPTSTVVIDFSIQDEANMTSLTDTVTADSNIKKKSCKNYTSDMIM